MTRYHIETAIAYRVKIQEDAMACMLGCDSWEAEQRASDAFHGVLMLASSEDRPHVWGRDRDVVGRR